ncbi:hypothetical protein [Sphingobium boeckii]|uniref:Uncharacterized protein n=1 Tax=Sphingobium boeckii TaxID=1082345 RepID=A0A7W9EFX8_9SPHN|nr:hypothetical protein [Sphingobium boeckii]MBB5686480.1 hypothetical protein [Sphingobium boeckii]
MKDGIEPKALAQTAIALMNEALTLLDRAEAWEASAHLDLAIRRLEAWDYDVQNIAGEA